MRVTSSNRGHYYSSQDIKGLQWEGQKFSRGQLKHRVKVHQKLTTPSASWVSLCWVSWDPIWWRLFLLALSIRLPQSLLLDVVSSPLWWCFDEEEEEEDNDDDGGDLFSICSSLSIISLLLVIHLINSHTQKHSYCRLFSRPHKTASLGAIPAIFRPLILDWIAEAMGSVAILSS